MIEDQQFLYESPTDEEQLSGSSSGIASLLKDARQRLVETGTRNRLVNVNRSASRANVLNIVNEKSDFVFDFLRNQSKKMRFKATGKDPKKLDEESDAPILETETPEEFNEDRYTDNQLETPLGPESQAKRLLRLSRDARAAEEEQGINILFLALGFLTWFEDKNSAAKREAPLILLPVELVRNAKTSAYDLRCRDDEIVTNLPLQERLRGDFGIELPEVEADEEDWSPSQYFDVLAAKIENKPEWSIDRDGMQLGFFSFAKLLMLRDLDPDNWSEGALENNGLVKGLLATGFASEPSVFEDHERLDAVLAPADIIQVVDADASQTKVIEEVRKGRNLVVQGPPGTGKSQTITNMIASAVHDGKTVLFVAEKMAALSVVHQRLNKSGLKDICLELHSRSANKRRVIEELGRTLSQGAATPQFPAAPQELETIRDQLNDIAGLIHSNVGKSGNTVFGILSHLVALAGKNAPAPEIDGEPLAQLSDKDIKRIEREIDLYRDALGSAQSRQDHPLFGIGNLSLQPTDLQRVKAELTRLKQSLEEFAARDAKIAQLAGIVKPTFADIEQSCEFLDTIASAPEHTAMLLPIFGSTEQTNLLTKQLQVGSNWQTQFVKLRKIFSDVAFDVPVDRLRAPIAAGTGGFLARLKGAYRSASTELALLLRGSLPKTAKERLSLVDQLLAARKQRAEFVSQTSSLSAQLGRHWQGERTNFMALLAIGQWLMTTRERANVDNRVLISLLEKKVSLASLPAHVRTQQQTILSQIEAVFENLHFETAAVFTNEAVRNLTVSGTLQTVTRLEGELMGKYAQWQQLSEAAAALSAASLDPVLEKLDSGQMSATEAKTEITYARSEALWHLARQQYPALTGVAKLNRKALVKRFATLDQQRTKDVQTLVRARHIDQLPRGAVGEMGIIRSEMGKKTRHKPVRKLIQQAGNMVQRIKPVLLMSPISIAQFLPPHSLEFDLLIIDEASQVRPEDALGAIARAKQIVVVGDTKQLPPTSFFDRITGNDDQEEDEEGSQLLEGAARATEMESILTLCEARAISSRMLEWHYRSRDPSLMRVSNKEFYHDNLVLPPSPLEQDAAYGMKFTKVDGAYTSASKGVDTKGTNKIEAQAIVDKISEHARHHPEWSLGVVTFSGRQRNMVTELLELARRTNGVLDTFLREGRPEDVFVKNIENVQGDERDVILVSVGYGPHEPGGKLLSMNFGPINREGGERRLNVLFSRTRIRCEIFASFEPGDIDLSRTQKEGPRILRRYLEYAKSGFLDQAIVSGRQPDSDFEIDVADEIRKLGFTVDYQVGSAGFVIDLAVKHPQRSGQYMLAVECDGATYHSALWARERDRLRQEILENLGWRFHRIWSTDWFYRRADEIERLERVLKNAAELVGDGIEVTGANAGFEFKSLDPEGENDENEPEVLDVSALPKLTCPVYRKADFAVNASVEPHEAPPSTMTEIVRRIVEIEGPIHEEEVAKRVAGLFGKNRAGSRIVEAVNSALKRASTASSSSLPKITCQGAFWMTEEQIETVPLRDRRNESYSLQKAEMIPPMEIAAAITLVLSDSGEANEDDISRAVAKLLGFDRVGPALRKAIGAALEKFADA